MRHTQLENLRASSGELIPSLEQLELKMQALNDESNTDKELRHVTRLLYVGLLVERDSLLYYLNKQTFCQLLLQHKNTLQKPTVKDT